MSNTAALSDIESLCWMWKTPSMAAMTVAVLTVALERGVNGRFSAMDLPVRGAEQQGGTGIAGTVMKHLKDAGIIAVAGVWDDGQFYRKTVINDGGNPIGVYQLANPGMARALLARHRPTPAGLVQETMWPEPKGV